MIRIITVSFLAIITFTSQSCDSNVRAENTLLNVATEVQTQKIEIINPDETRVATRFMPPNNFVRREVPVNSFAIFLRNLPLKPHGTLVSYYDGTQKENQGVYLAVVDLPIGKKDLHQCADAVMRLRADYLYVQQRYNEIHFNFTNGFQVDYSEYMKGNRMVVSGNKTY